MPAESEYFILLHDYYRSATLVKLIPLESLRLICMLKILSNLFVNNV